MITKTTATVWHSSAKGRRYFSRSAAIRAEARSIIYKLYPSEGRESDEYGRTTYPGYDIQYDEPERYAKLYRRIKRLVERKMKKDSVSQPGTLTNEDTKQSANSPVIPDGWKIVPIEPTEKMLTASYMFSYVDNTIDSWKAMLNVAPQPPVESTEG